MRRKLEIQIQRAGTKLTAALSGAMDAAADYSPLIVPGVTEVHLSLQGVTLIDSIGINVLYNSMAKLPKETALAVDRCPVFMVQQLNIWPNIFGGRPNVVRSFFVPYFCAKCDESVERLLETSALLQDGSEPELPELPCGKCGEAMDFDGNDTYLDFLAA